VFFFFFLIQGYLKTNPTKSNEYLGYMGVNYSQIVWIPVSLF